MNRHFRGRCHSYALPGEDEDDVVGGEADEDAVGGALHLRPAQDEDGDEVAHEPERPHAVQQDPWQKELEDEVLGRNSMALKHDLVKKLLENNFVCYGKCQGQSLVNVCYCMVVKSS